MVHDAAAEGYSRRAATYQSARPSYHPDLISRFVDRFGSGDVVEIGAGTGIFTKQIVEAGVEVVAVEPVEAMRRELLDRLPGTDVRTGTAEDLPLDDGSADTVVVAQAFHWFDHRPALDEIHRVLRPGGNLVTVWNVRDERVGWFKAYTEVLDRYAAGTPRHRAMVWRRAIDDDRRHELVDDWSRDNPWPTDKQGVVDRALSTSFIAALPSEEQEAVAAQILRVLEPHDDRLDFPYRAELQAWRLVAT